MSFHQNTSNQRAPQEQSEPEANSSPASRWTGVPTYAQSVGNAASFGEQMESNSSYVNEFNNDDNSNLMSQGSVSLFSNEESGHEDGSNSNEDPLVSNYLPPLYFSASAKPASKLELLELLKISFEGLEQLLISGVRTPGLRGKEMIAAMKAQAILLQYLLYESPKHSFCRRSNRRLETVEQGSNTSTDFIQENFHQNENDASDIEATFASIMESVELLKTWNKKHRFLFGQSEKFANVVCAKDLLPQNDGPTTCGICFSTIEESSDFAVQSECIHIFCTPCIATWFKTKQNCPMCRQSGLFMSKDRFLELRSSGPGPAH